MNFTYDKEADAAYIELSDAEFAANKRLDDVTILDLDNKNQIIGIELLDASKRITASTLAQAKQISK